MNNIDNIMRINYQQLHYLDNNRFKKQYNNWLRLIQVILYKIYIKRVSANDFKSIANKYIESFDSKDKTGKNAITQTTIQTYKLDRNLLPHEISITRDEILKYYKEMEIMRAMEVKCDGLYKSKHIRGFCHLYSGQEAIAEGMEAALTFDDPLITAYRVHCQAYKRGYSVRQILAEMFGKGQGATHGKGGSMHYYKKDTNFYGGNGIVGSQIPVGTGLAFALKYKGNKKNVASIMFGDGAANQGQMFESFNMAKLWNLPALFICENNVFGMGTSINRSSMNPHFYTKGDQIPGIQADGNNVFQVKQVIKYAKSYAIEKGPLCIQFMTYRYSGHSMSDPGDTYRTRDEVKQHRLHHDPIKRLMHDGIQNKLVTQEQLDKIKQQADTHVDHQLSLAEKDHDASLSQLMTHVYIDNQNHFIRGKVYQESQFVKGQQH